MSAFSFTELQEEPSIFLSMTILEDLIFENPFFIVFTASQAALLALRKVDPEFISVDSLHSHLLFANLNLLLTMAWARERASLFDGDLSLLNKVFLWFRRSMADLRESLLSRNQSGVLLLVFFGMISMAERIVDVRIE